VKILITCMSVLVLTLCPVLNCEPPQIDRKGRGKGAKNKQPSDMIQRAIRIPTDAPTRPRGRGRAKAAEEDEGAAADDGEGHEDDMILSGQAAAEGGAQPGAGKVAYWWLLCHVLVLHWAY
jgi:hypothetical protein